MLSEVEGDPNQLLTVDVYLLFRAFPATLLNEWCFHGVHLIAMKRIAGLETKTIMGSCVFLVGKLSEKM